MNLVEKPKLVNPTPRIRIHQTEQGTLKIVNDALSVINIRESLLQNLANIFHQLFTFNEIREFTSVQPSIGYENKNLYLSVPKTITQLLDTMLCMDNRMFQVMDDFGQHLPTHHNGVRDYVSAAFVIYTVYEHELFRAYPVFKTRESLYSCLFSNQRIEIATDTSTDRRTHYDVMGEINQLFGIEDE